MYLSWEERAWDIIRDLHLDTATFAPYRLDGSLQEAGPSIKVTFALTQYLARVHSWLL